MEEIIEITVQQWVDLTSKLESVERIAYSVFIGFIVYLVGCIFFEIFNIIMKKKNNKDSKDLD